MTIAACCITPEGVALGADSTATFMTADKQHHYLNHAQKLFEIGEDSSLGIIIWGMAGFPDLSYRTLIHRLSEKLLATTPPATSLDVVMTHWIDIFWAEYQKYFAAELVLCATLVGKSKHDPANPNPPNTMRTKVEEDNLSALISNLYVGFCIGGYALPDRKPDAYFVEFDPSKGRPTPGRLAMGEVKFWGAPIHIMRTLHGYDNRLVDLLMASGKWTGTAAELQQSLGAFAMSLPLFPIREAVDFIHSSISGTIKALKFSHLAQTCGGPIETAVITTDRRFRWVTHKEWNSALTDGDQRWTGR